jgi:uncharacterized membrane protein
MALPTRGFVTTTATVGVIAAGVALLEVALIPGMVIGGAAMLAPRVLPKWARYLRPLVGKGRRATALLREPRAPAAAPASPPELKPTLIKRPPVKRPPVKLNLPLVSLTRPTLNQAIAKTVTFRIIVTSLDFTVNYVVIGEFAIAAGLSGFSLVVGPLFYLLHESIWNKFGGADKRVDLIALLPRGKMAGSSPARPKGLTISRAVAKTITFRGIATAMDFTTNFVVVGDLATAVVLSSSGFILGPFVYFGHEMAWDYFSGAKGPTPAPAASTRLLPAPT